MNSSSSKARVHLALVLAAVLVPLAAACEDDSGSLAGGPADGAAFDAGHGDGGGLPNETGPTDGAAPDADAPDSDVPDGSAPDADAGDARDDAGTPPPGWTATADVVAGQQATRTTMLTTRDGRALLAFREGGAVQTMRVVRWHGADTGVWTNLGTPNAGVPGSLETPGDPQERFVGLAFAGAQRVVAAFRQNGAVYANVHDGAAWGAPFVLSSAPSAVAVAGDGTGRALVAYRTENGQVGARVYSAATQTWGSETIISLQDRVVDTANSFWVEAKMNAGGDALVVFRGHLDVPTTTRDIYTARYAAATGAWTLEDTGYLNGSLEPERLCLALNDAGAAVVSLREGFTNQFGTFTRTRAAYRAAVATTWASWQTLDGPTFHDGCALSADGTAIVTSLVGVGAGDEITPHRYANGVWSTGTPIATKSVASGSRFVLAMASDGRAAGGYLQTDNELRFHRFTPATGWVASDTWTRVNSVGTSLDQFFKGGMLLDDGRYLWVYQDLDGALRYAVHR